MRSIRPEVMNPLLALPAMGKLRAVLERHPEVRGAVLELMAEIRADCATRAERAWVKHKGPVASYWRVTGTIVGHTARAIKRSVK